MPNVMKILFIVLWGIVGFGILTTGSSDLMSIRWWVFVALIASVMVALSFFAFGTKVLKKVGIYVLFVFLVVAPVFVVNQALIYRSVAQSLTSSKEIDYFRNVLGRSYNYTELVQWENEALKWSYSVAGYTDPIDIYNCHEARCGGYAILYAELCVSQGYQARIVVSLFNDHAWNEVKLDGEWTRVDASPTGASMSENIGYPLFYEERWLSPPILALAFENSSIVDVTSNYRSDHWSLLSLITTVFFFTGTWVTVYCLLLGLFIVLLLPKIRRDFRDKQWYKDRLNVFVLIRQVLLFLFPFVLATVILGPATALNQLLALIALGLSITVFWVVQLPLLMKADIMVTFDVNESDYTEKMVLDAEKEEHVVNTRVQNMGFSTLKNAMVEIYFGDVFEATPSNDTKYKGLDFHKKFSIQKKHCGIVFVPSDNFQTIPPQEVFIFPVILRTPNDLQKSNVGKVTIQFSSESSWGMKIIQAPIEIVKK